MADAITRTEESVKHVQKEFKLAKVMETAFARLKTTKGITESVND